MTLETLTREEIINQAKDLKEDYESDPTHPKAWVSPELLESHPLGFVVYPHKSFCNVSIEYGSLPGRVCVFCDPEIDVNSWYGYVIAGIRIGDMVFQSFEVSPSVAQMAYGEDLAYLVAAPWYSVSMP